MSELHLEKMVHVCRDGEMEEGRAGDGEIDGEL